MTDSEACIYHGIAARAYAHYASLQADCLVASLDRLGKLKAVRGARRLESRAAKVSRELRAIGKAIREGVVRP